MGRKIEKQKWLRLDGEDDWQIVIPNTDILPHSTTSRRDAKNDSAWLDCPCKPKVNLLDKIIVHNSFQDIARIDESMAKLDKQLIHKCFDK